MAFQVMVSSHGAYQEDGYKHGEFPDLASATAACKKIVDDFLLAQNTKAPGQSSQDLFRLYSAFGEDPYVVGVQPSEFSAWDYAKERCRQLVDGERRAT
jgi:hypothetical protein